MANEIQPPRSPLVDRSGDITPEWYRFLSFLSRDVQRIAVEVAAMPPGESGESGESGEPVDDAGDDAQGDGDQVAIDQTLMLQDRVAITESEIKAITDRLEQQAPTESANEMQSIDLRLTEIETKRDEELAEVALNRARLLAEWDQAHIDANDPHPQYLLPEELPQTLVSYFTSSQTFHPPDYDLARTGTAVPGGTPIATTVYGDDVLCGRWSGEPAENGLLYAEVETRCIIDIDGESTATFVYAVAILNHTAGGSEELGRSGPILLEENRNTYAFTIQIGGFKPVELFPGDWTSIEIYGTKDGGGPDRTVTVYVDSGVSRNITFLPIPAYPAAHATTHETGGTDEIPELAAATALLASHEHTGGDGTPQVSHENLANRYSANQHRITNITDLSDELNAKTYALYISQTAPTNTAVGDIGAAWVDIASPTPNFTPLNFTDEGSGRVSAQFSSVYLLMINGAFEHNSSNDGRVTNLRLYDYTNDVAGVPVVIGSGRNQEATAISIAALVEVTTDQVGHVFGLQLGGGDAYTGVVLNVFSYALVNAGIADTDYT